MVPRYGRVFSAADRLRLSRSSRMDRGIKFSHDAWKHRPTGTTDPLRSVHRTRARSTDAMCRMGDRRSGGPSRCSRPTSRQWSRNRVACSGWLHRQCPPFSARPLDMDGADHEVASRPAVGASPRRRSDEHARVLHPCRGCSPRAGRMGASRDRAGSGRCPVGEGRSTRNGEEGSCNDRAPFPWTWRKGGGQRSPGRCLRRSGRAHSVRSRSPTGGASGDLWRRQTHRSTAVGIAWHLGDNQAFGERPPTCSATWTGPTSLPGQSGLPSSRQTGLGDRCRSNVQHFAYPFVVVTPPNLVHAALECRE